jgi:Protein of unknown function (DUF 659)
MSQTSAVDTKSDIIWSCYETDDGGNKRCKLLDLRGRRCDQKYSQSTRSTNPGIHIKAKHSHCKDIIAQLESIESANQHKKRVREETRDVELPSKVVKLNQLPNQTKMTDHLKMDGTSLRKELNEAIALMVSVHSLPMSFVESSYLQTVLNLYQKCLKAGAIKQLDGRQRITQSEHDLVQSIKHSVTEALQSSTYPITLAFDGWQNTNHLHVQNIVAQSSSASVFLKSDLSRERATAENLFAFIEPVLDGLIEQKIEVGGIVADNASVNGKIARLLQNKYPWILPLPCASHTLQLCIVRLFEQDSVAEGIKSIVRDVVKAISNSNVRLTEFLRVQGDHAVHLVKPQKTRWSSYHRACSAVLRLRPFVELALRRIGTDAEHPVLARLTVSFWNNLADLVNFLEPFSFASNVIQSDQASLLDVHIQFSTLHSHSLNAPLSLTHGASVMQAAIRQHWRKNVKQEAVYMVAQFAHESTDNALFADVVKVDAPDWFVGWGAQLWLHHESLKAAQPSDLTQQERAAHLAQIEQTIHQQYTSFLMNEFPYNRIRTQIQNNRPSQYHHTSKFVPFDAFTPWLRMKDLSSGKELIHAVITLLSLNCSEASVERSFSQQKLTHSLLMNRKLPATVERQMYIKSNHRVMRRRNQGKKATMRSTSIDDDSAIHDRDSSEDVEYESDTDIELFDSDESGSDDEDNEEEEHVPAEPGNPAPSNPAVAQSSRAALPPYPRVIQQALSPARRTWTMVLQLTEALDDFCKSYIAVNELKLPSPFARRGAAKLRDAMEADPSVTLEQPSDAQRHILFLLEQTERAAQDEIEA